MIGRAAFLLLVVAHVAAAGPFLETKVPTSVGVSGFADPNLEGAKVSIDGVVVGLAIKVVRPGRHLIEIEKPGFEKLSQWVDVQANERNVIAPKLEKTTATFHVVSRHPDDLEVVVDGWSRGRLPLEVENVKPGRHTVRLKLEGVSVFEEEYVVSAGERITIKAPSVRPVIRRRILQRQVWKRP